jgi:hypothetical protein
MPKALPRWPETCQAPGNSLRLIALSRELRQSIPATVGHWTVLLWWVLRDHPTGDVSLLHDREIEHYALWDGPPGRFVDALARVGLLSLSETHRLICDLNGMIHPDHPRHLPPPTRK